MKTKIQHGTLIILIAMGLLMGCSPASDPITTATPTTPLRSEATSTVAPTATATPTPTPTATPLPLGGQQTQYFIEATIDYYNRFVTATSRSVYTNKTNGPIDDILFIIYPTIFQAIYTRSVTTGEGTQVTDYYWDDHRMVIPLDQPLLPGQQIEFIHKYELYLPDRGGVFSHSGKQLNLSYWFPYIPPYDEKEGWIAHDVQLVNSAFVGEFLVFEAADYDVTLSFTDRRENFLIAAPALPSEENGKIHYSLELARTFTLSISDQFVVFTRQVDQTTLHSYVFAEHASVGEVTADIAVEAFTLYSELYGPYGRDILSVVEFNSDIGMEFDGLIFLSPYFYNLYPGTPQSNIHVYTAHEMAHQWFFSLVGNDQALEPWLDEAFATYSERIFYERYYSDHLDWYWENYITLHNPHGEIDVSIYFGGDLFEYRDIVYRNGALFLHDLRNILGDDVYYGFIKDYVQQYRYEIATAEGFWSTLSLHTDADLTTLITTYFSRTPQNIP